MFWKNKSLRNLSLENRLMMLFTSAIMVILLLTGFAFYNVLVNVIYEAGKQYLIDEAIIIRDIFSRSSDQFAELKQEINGVPVSLKNASYSYYIQLETTDGHKLLATPGIQKALIGVKFPPLNVKNWYLVIPKWISPSGKIYFLLTAPVQFDQAHHTVKLMHMAFDITYYQHLINDYRFFILAYWLVCIALFVFIGKLLARKGLSSLVEIAARTQEISCSNLSNRLNAARWPKEMLLVVKEFNKMIDRLEDGFNSLSQCAVELAHDLRSPINNLMGETEIILSKPRENEEYRYAHELNLNEYRRLSQLVENILFLASTDNSKISIEKTAINFVSEMNIICDYFEIIANEKKIKLKKEGNVIVYANTILFRRAISNLVSNAVKFTPSGGKILVSASRDSEFVVVKVQDSGIGIAENQQPLVTNRFYRVNNDYSKEKEGLGFGLAIVKSVIDLHEGKMAIQSEINVGTTVTLFFPNNFNLVP
jgi:two-component system, OmpR family, heavy metal sensor histidine kinase CusS